MLNHLAAALMGKPAQLSWRSQARENAVLPDRKGICDVKTPCFKQKETMGVVSETVALSPVQPLNGQRVLRISQLMAVNTNQRTTR